MVGILGAFGARRRGPEQSYEPEELSHIMPWAHGKPEEGAAEAEGAPPQQAEPGNPGCLPGWAM